MDLNQNTIRHTLVPQGIVPQTIFVDAAAAVTVIPLFVAAGTPVVNAGACTVAWPAGHVAGQLGILFVSTPNNPVTFTDDGGFVAVTGASQGSGSANASGATLINAYWCRATSGAMPSVVIADGGNHQMGVILTFSGCLAAGDPYEAVAGDNRTTSTAVAIPGGSTAGANRLVLAAVSGATDVTSTTELASWANAALASLTERVNWHTDTAHGGGFGVVTGGLATAGAVGTTTATFTTGTAQARISFALIPA